MTPATPALRFDPSHDWRIKYLQLTWNLTRLRRLYAETRASVDDVETAARYTFAACVDLAAWLDDGRAPASVDAADVDKLLDVDPLRVCVALAGGLAAASAVLVPTKLGTAGRAWVEYRRDAVRSVRFDALDLAERCVASWNVFLGARGVSLPTWAPTSRSEFAAS